MRLMHRSRRRRSARAGLLCRLFSPSHPGKLLIVSGRQAPRQGEQEGMQMNYRFHAGIAALATCLAGSPVQAQESSQTQMSSDLDGDIIVTARRQAERLQDVPISIIAIDGYTLNERNVKTLNDLPAVSAGLSVQNRSEERRVGKECVSTCSTRWSMCI